MIPTTGSSVLDDQNNEYVLDEPIGRGGFGLVYKAHRKNDHAVFAVKTLLSDVGGDEGFRTFENEVALSKGIESDHVIRYFYTHTGKTYPTLPPYIIMEYAPDKTLEDLISNAITSKQKFSADSLREMFGQLIDGMKAINAVIVHRDIKPQNILRFGNTLKISDFGLSKYAFESTRSATLKGYGSLLYIAPEGWRSEKNTTQMDIYSMGIVFYQLATLEYPYKDINQFSDVDRIKTAHLSAPVNKACLNLNLPQNMISVILRMLEKSVDKRYKNWDEIASGLEAPATSNSLLAHAVEGAIKHTLSADLLKQEKTAAILSAKQQVNDFKQIVLYQFEETVVEPLSDFVERYRALYQGVNSISLTKPFDNTTIMNNNRVSFYIMTPYRTKISVELEIILKENHIRKNYYDRMFGTNKYIEENYIPECEHRKILAWGYIRVDNWKGYNLLLLQKIDSDDFYGDWFILENHPSHLAPTDKSGPFALNFNEIEQAIIDIHAMSYINSTLKPLSVQLLYDFVNECIDHDKYKI